MNKKHSSWTLILLVISVFFNNTAVRSQNTDFKIALHESMLNKLLLSLGEIKGASNYSFMFIDGVYYWTLFNPQINLHANKAEFTTDVKVTIGKLNYTNHVVGKMEVCYEPSTNLIYIEMREALYPLNITFMGQERTITTINLATYFETPFTFEGPLSASTTMQFEMPDKSIKTLYAHPKNCAVKIAEKVIIVSADVEFLQIPTLTADNK